MIRREGKREGGWACDMEGMGREGRRRVLVQVDGKDGTKWIVGDNYCGGA